MLSLLRNWMYSMNEDEVNTPQEGEIVEPATNAL
jgi:hypothetical protein